MKEDQENKKFEDHIKRVNETVLLCTEFLLTNASDIELSNKTSISSSTVGRRLTNKTNILDVYAKVKENLILNGWNESEIPQNGEELYRIIGMKRQENLLRGKTLGGQTTLLNHLYTKSEDGKFADATKIKIDVIYKDVKSQYRFIVHAALTFRLHLNTLSSLLQIDENELLEKMITIVPNAYDAIIYLLYHDNYEQENARNEFLEYYRELINAIRLKDLNEKKRLINIISDSEVAEFKKNHETGDLLKEQEIEAILKYQIKYALTQNEIADIFDINKGNYQKRIEKILLSSKSLRLKYEYLSDYNTRKFNEVRKHG